MSKKRKKEHIGICPLCGMEKMLTKEHAVPKCLFRSPLPKNMITVYTCKECNKSYSVDEEYFRIFVLGGSCPGSKAFSLWFEKVEGSSLQRSPALRQKLIHDMDISKVHHRVQPLRFYSGEQVPDDIVENTITFQADRINRVVGKIIRCLYFKHFNKPIPIDSKVQISTAPLTEYEQSLLYSNYKGIIGDKNRDFLYWFGDDSKRMKWLLLFYEFKEFRVFVPSI